MIRILSAASLAAYLSACAVGDSLITAPLEGDENFEYLIEGDMAVPLALRDEVFLASGGSGPDTVFLNFDGATIHHDGWRQNNAQTDSSFITDGDRQVPAFDGSHWPGTRAQLIAELLAGVREDFAGYGVEIVDERPTQGAYTMILVGGSPGDIGLSTGLLGVAPFDANNWNASDVGFVFSDAAGESGYLPRYLAHVISHELGHTVGLAHITRTADIMRPAACHCAQSWGAGPLANDATQSQDDQALLHAAFPSTGQSPIGRLNSINQEGHLRGWACDGDDPEASIDVELYFGGIAGSGAESLSLRADHSNGLPVTNACGGGSAHRFESDLDLAAHCGELVYAYGVNLAGSGGANTLLTASPKSMPVCSPDSPAVGSGPTVVAEPADCGASSPWIEEGTHAAASSCGNTCSGYHFSYCDFNGDSDTSDGWQYCLSSGWAPCQYHPH